MVVAMLLLSSVAVLAKEKTEPTTIANQDEVKQPKEKFDKINEHRTKAKEQLVKAKLRGQELKERYAQAKERYEQAHKKIVMQRSELGLLKERVTKCQKEECPEQRSKLRQGVQRHLLNTLNVMDSSLEKLINRVESSKLTDEEKEDALTDLLAAQEQLTEKKSEVEAIAAEDNPTELKEAIKELKTLWQETKKTQRQIIVSLMKQQLVNVVEKQDDIAQNMQDKIAELSLKEIDVTSLEELQATFVEQKEKVELAHNNLRDVWTGVSDEHKEALEALKEELKEAKGIVRQFMQEYRSLKEPLEEVNEMEA